MHLDQFTSRASGRTVPRITPYSSQLRQPYDTVERGTRVEPSLLVNPNHDHGPRTKQVEAVHTAETHLAQLTGTSHPNCVNACEYHTQQLDRAIEI